VVSLISPGVACDSGSIAQLLMQAFLAIRLPDLELQIEVNGIRGDGHEIPKR
jgi:hypothetical protein